MYTISSQAIYSDNTKDKQAYVEMSLSMSL